VPAGHDFDEIRTQFPRGDDSGWGKCSRDHDNILLYGELHRFRIEAVARKKLCPRIQAAACGLDIVDTASSDNHIGTCCTT